MIIQKYEIKQIAFSLFGEELEPNIKERQENGVYKADVPIKFNYNGSWFVEHLCPSCYSVCNFSSLLDRSHSLFVTTNFVRINYLCTKYYSENFVGVISNLFSQTKLLERANSKFVVFNDTYDLNLLVGSSIQPLYYACKNCSGDFLGLVRIFYPYPPDASNPSGMLGEVNVDELIQIKVKENKTFLELLNENAIK